MYRLLQLLLVFSLFIRTNGKQLSYFERRKQMLHKTNISLHPRPPNSKVPEFYYGPQKPKSSHYQLIINEDQMCSKHEKVFLLVAVRTIYTHDIRRRIFREVFSHYQRSKSSLPVRYVFLFGKSDDDSDNRLIKEESLMFRDIVQADFLESDRNLTRKTLLAWKWSIEYCPNAEYVMVMDDELFIDMDKLTSFLLEDFLIGHHDDRFALCNRIGDALASNHTRKQSTLLPVDDIYKGAYYPPYCNGYGYVAHIKTISKLLEASVSNPYFMPDDVWIGVLSEKLRLQLPNHRSLYIDSDIESLFKSEVYYSSPALIIVTGAGINKGYEHIVMLNIFFSIREHWQNMNEQLHCSIGRYTDLKLLFILLFIFVCLLKYRRAVLRFFHYTKN